MTIAIAAGSVCVQTQHGNYLAPTNWKSLSQWIHLFRDVRLIAMRSAEKSPPSGWVRLPEHTKVCLLDVLGKSHFSRHLAVHRTAGEYLREAELLYARMPDYEVYRVFCEAAKRKIPVLLELHGDWETSARVSDINGGFLRRITRRFRVNYTRKAYFKMVEQAFAVVTIGPALAEKYVQGEKPLLISTNNTVEESQYQQRHEHALKTVPRLLFVGELVGRKGLRYLFASLKQLKGQGYKFEMILAGNGPEEGCLRAYSKGNGFDKYVNFVGHIPFGQRLLQYYREADIFVLPSIAAEGVPRVVHEAMSQGCPVIATDVGSIKWQLEGGAGIVVPPADAAALTESIIRVLGDKELRRCLSINGFNRSMEFTYEKQGEKIAAFVRKHIPTKLLV